MCAPTPANPPPQNAAPPNDGNSIMQQVAAQERRIAELQQQLEDGNRKLAKFQTAKKQEMEALLSGLKEWLGNIGLQSENDKMEVEKGLERLVNNGADDNGIWRVMVTASANARQRESDYQQLKTAYDNLQKSSHAQPELGSFQDDLNRVGSKRAASGEPDASVGDIWGAFIADVSQNGY